ncbi:MAG: hypothetical protein ABIS21_05700 [Acidimicrobiales bacterium]
MVHLVSVHDTFHARVIAARLGSDGILTELRGAVDGPYPVRGEVRVYVVADDLPVARELLLADEVEAVFDDHGDGEKGASRAIPVWLAVAAVVMITCVWLARVLH